MSSKMKVVIQAGGMGSRLNKVTGGRIPKPLARLNGKTMLDWQFEQLKRYGFTDVYLIVGHLGEKIKEYYGDGEEAGIKISYIQEKEPLGSAGALYYLKEKIGINDFILLFGDIIFNIDINKMETFHKKKESMATLFVHPNSHPYDSDLIVLNDDCQIVKFIGKNYAGDRWYHNCVNAGIYILSGKILDNIEKLQRMDLEKDLLQKILGEGNRLYGYSSTEYVRDAGTVERFCSIGEEMKCFMPEKRNLEKKQKCIFIDRDGTVNKLKGLLADEKDMELIDGVADAIRKINLSGFLAIIVTNQPVIARGMCSINELETIHKKMETLLGRQGAYLDDIIYCPHHPDKGYPEENPVYKIECGCRKPGIGMFLTMQEKYNIDLSVSYIVGDTTTDIMTGRNAGMHTVLVKTGEGGKDGKYNVIPEIVANDLAEAVQIILSDGKV